MCTLIYYLFNGISKIYLYAHKILSCSTVFFFKDMNFQNTKDTNQEENAKSI